MWSGTNGVLICDRYERNNLATWIKQQPDAEFVESTFGAFYRLDGYCVAMAVLRVVVRSKFTMPS